jgi:hypothetical protein
MPYICYIDEAGCATPLPSAQTDIQPLFIVVGLVLDIARVSDVTLRFLELKRRFFPRKFSASRHLLDDVLIEIKGSDLRSSIRKHGEKAMAALKFVDTALDLLRENEARIFASIWVKGIGKAIDSRAIYTTSIQAACRNFSVFLAAHQDNGFMIADFRTPGLNTQVSHSIFTQKYSNKGDPLARLLELPTFGHSNNHVPLQIADLVCSTLLFPMATASYCAGQIIGKHVRGRDMLIKRRYANRVKSLQYRHKDSTGKASGGIFVSDALRNNTAERLFQFDAISSPTSR